MFEVGHHICSMETTNFVIDFFNWANQWSVLWLPLGDVLFTVAVIIISGLWVAANAGAFRRTPKQQREPTPLSEVRSSFDNGLSEAKSLAEFPALVIDKRKTEDKPHQ